MGILVGVAINNSATHLLFAYDCLIAVKVTYKKPRFLSTGYILCSNQSISLSKCYRLWQICGCQNLEDGLQITFDSCGTISFKYLSVFVGGKRAPMSYFDGLIYNVREKLRGLKCEILSLAVRNILLQSVLSAMPSFVLTNGCVPKSILDALEKEFHHSFGARVCLSHVEQDLQTTQEERFGIQKLDVVEKT